MASWADFGIDYPSSTMALIDSENEDRGLQSSSPVPSLHSHRIEQVSMQEISFLHLIR
jgi:hypothetical protein